METRPRDEARGLIEILAIARENVTGQSFGGLDRRTRACSTRVVEDDVDISLLENGCFRPDVDVKRCDDP